MNVTVSAEQYALKQQGKNLQVINLKTGSMHTYFDRAIPDSFDEAIFLVESCLCFL